MLRIKLTKSPIANTPKNRATVRALGLRKLNQVVQMPDNAAIRGMIHRVKHLLAVEVVEGEPASRLNRPRRKAGSARKSAAPKLLVSTPATASPKKAATKPKTEQPAQVTAKPAAAKPAGKPAAKRSASKSPASGTTAKASTAKKTAPAEPKEE